MCLEMCLSRRVVWLTATLWTTAKWPSVLAVRILHHNALSVCYVDILLHK